MLDAPTAGSGVPWPPYETTRQVPMLTAVEPGGLGAPDGVGRPRRRRPVDRRRGSPTLTLGIVAAALLIALVGAGLVGATLLGSRSTPDSRERSELAGVATTAPADIPTLGPRMDPAATIVPAAGEGPTTERPAAGPEERTTPSTEPTIAPTRTPSGQPTPTAVVSLEDAAERAKRFTALVITNEGTGSAFAVGDGRFITNFHVVDGARGVRVRVSDERTLPAQVIQYDELRDLALLQVGDAGVPAADLRDARQLRSAETLLVVGYPKAGQLRPSEATVTRGIYSARWQSPTDVWHVQMDAPINPGNSGGPVVDAQGRVVGVATMSLRGTVGLNFAVASDEVQSFLGGRGAVTPAPPPGQAPADGRAPVQAARPELANVAVGTADVQPGGSVTLNYAIVNPNDVSVRVSLGASIRPGSGKWLDDRTNDRTVSIPPGRSTQSRSFRIPADATPGAYDVWTSLLSDDMRTSFGQEVESGALTVQHGASAAPAPPPAPAPRPSAAEDTVRRFYTALGARDFQTAWSLLTPRYKTGVAYDTWVGGYRTTQSVKVVSASAVSQTGSAATVQVTITSTDVGQTLPQTFSGTWQLTNAGGSWLLDVANMRKVN